MVGILMTDFIIWTLQNGLEINHYLWPFAKQGIFYGLAIMLGWYLRGITIDK
jgi:hypothetical protein